MGIISFLTKKPSRRNSPGGTFIPFEYSAFTPTSDSARNTTAQACISVIANAVSIMPLDLYEKKSDGSRAKAIGHSLHRCLRRRPNPGETPTLFMARLVRHIFEFGNAFVFPLRTGFDIVRMDLFDPRGVTVRYDGTPLEKYLYKGREYDTHEVLRISSLITNERGYGIAPLALAKAAALLGIQLDAYSLASFGNGINTKLLIDISEMTKDVQGEEEATKIAQTVADYVRRHYVGQENSGKPLITIKGMKVEELKNQSSNRDAELLESRKWQELEICKAFGVPPWMVNGSYDVKYGGLEPAMTVFINFTLSPYLRHIEQSFNTLMSERDQDSRYLEFNQNILLRPDEKARADFYSKLFLMGAIDANGICARENMDPPAEGGTARFVPANLMPLREDVLEAYMASAKQKAQDLLNGAPAKDPAQSLGSQAQ